MTIGSHGQPAINRGPRSPGTMAGVWSAKVTWTDATTHAVIELEKINKGKTYKAWLIESFYLKDYRDQPQYVIDGGHTHGTVTAGVIPVGVIAVGPGIDPAILNPTLTPTTATTAGPIVGGDGAHIHTLHRHRQGVDLANGDRVLVSFLNGSDAECVVLARFPSATTTA